MGHRRACVTENKVTSPFVVGRKTWQLASIARGGVTSHIHETKSYLIDKSPQRTALSSPGVEEGTYRMAQEPRHEFIRGRQICHRPMTPQVCAMELHSPRGP